MKYDVLIIGSGVAGLVLALSLAEDARIALVSKEGLFVSASQHAQGGIAAVMNEVEDSIASHVADTLRAGAGLSDPHVVEYVVMQARSAVSWLANVGVPFARAEGAYHLTQEGGHSHPRILHVADCTGAVIIKTLIEAVNQHSNIDCFTEHIAIDLCMTEGRCVGAWFYDVAQQATRIMAARQTILATGGASYIYQHTSNPNRTTGDGIAMAWRAGAQITNLEFTQFHPTCLYQPEKPEADRCLITEVVRGEGGYLLLPNGRRFMYDYDDRAELAPRDIVARAIDAELKKHHLECVYLDISHRPADFIKKAFPTIYKKCSAVGLDMSKEPLPVVPAAHYTCGGVVTDLRGRTNIPGLYAIGEVANTGLHGANRIASNSLLECVVFAASTARDIKKECQTASSVEICSSIEMSFLGNAQDVAIADLTQEVRQIMWCWVGIVRNNRDLTEATRILLQLLNTLESQFLHQQLSRELIELRNMMTVASLTAQSALQRKESRGLHYNTDYSELVRAFV